MKPSPLLSGTVALGLLLSAAEVRRSDSIAAADEPRAGAGGASQREATADTPKDDAEPVRSLDIVIAEHVILWDGEIVTWEQVIEGLRARRKREGKPIHPHFYFTNAAVAKGLEKKYEAAAFEVYQELFQPAGVSIGAISPRADERYDAIREAADLLPRPEQVRTGIVRSLSGRPVWRASVFVVPEKGNMPVMLRPGISLRDPIVLRDTLDEVWTMTDRQGGFRIASPDAGHRLVVFGPQGFAVVPVPERGQTVEITLAQRCDVEIASSDKSRQMLNISVLAPGLPGTFPGFSLFEVEIGEQAAVVQLPPGKVTVSRMRHIGDGVHVNHPAATFELKPGTRKTLSLPPPDPEKIPRAR